MGPASRRALFISAGITLRKAAWPNQVAQRCKSVFEISEHGELNRVTGIEYLAGDTASLNIVRA
jgi:hypothetical protein